MNELWILFLGVICAVGMPVLLGNIASYMTIKKVSIEESGDDQKGIVLEEAMRPGRRPIVIIPCVTVFYDRFVIGCDCRYDARLCFHPR